MVLLSHVSRNGASRVGGAFGAGAAWGSGLGPGVATLVLVMPMRGTRLPNALLNMPRRGALAASRLAVRVGLPLAASGRAARARTRGLLVNSRVAAAASRASAESRMLV